jgi:formate hydrogenlyase subunit 4
VVSLAAVAAALLIVPLGGVSGLLAFPGDLILFAYLLGLMRFVTVLAALDTGSAFEGMGASREVTFSALAEPALLISLACLARQTASLSLSGIYAGLDLGLIAAPGGVAALLAGAAIFIVLLTENARIPIDDPNTHLELTMIHEAMVLDHGGPDLAFIEYGAALKLWVLSALLVGVLAPIRGPVAVSAIVSLVAMGLLAIVIGVVESVMARLRLIRVPQLLSAAMVLAVLALAVAAFAGSPGR